MVNSYSLTWDNGFLAKLRLYLTNLGSLKFSGNSLSYLPEIRVRSCEVSIIWPDGSWWTMIEASQPTTPNSCTFFQKTSWRFQPTHLKNRLVKIGSSPPRYWGEHENMVWNQPPPRKDLHHLQDSTGCVSPNKCCAFAVSVESEDPPVNRPTIGTSTIHIYRYLSTNKAPWIQKWKSYKITQRNL